MNAHQVLLLRQEGGFGYGGDERATLLCLIRIQLSRFESTTIRIHDDSNIEEFVCDLILPPPDSGQDL